MTSHGVVALAGGRIRSGEGQTVCVCVCVCVCACVRERERGRERERYRQRERREAGALEKHPREKQYVTRGSRVIPQRTTSRAQVSLASEIGRELAFSDWFERTMPYHELTRHIHPNLGNHRLPSSHGAVSWRARMLKRKGFTFCLPPGLSKQQCQLGCEP